MLTAKGVPGRSRALAATGLKPCTSPPLLRQIGPAAVLVTICAPLATDWKSSYLKGAAVDFVPKLEPVMVTVPPCVKVPLTLVIFRPGAASVGTLRSVGKTA